MPSRAIDSEALRVGRILKAVRDQQGDLTQAEVAAALGKTEGAYAAYETGRSRFTLPELPAVARALKVDVGYLSRRLGLCGDNTDMTTLLVEYAGPEVGHLVANAVTNFPTMSDDQRRFFVYALQRL